MQLQRDGRVHRITMMRDEARLRELQAEAPGAWVVRAGETLNLDLLTEASRC